MLPPWLAAAKSRGDSAERGSILSGIEEAGASPEERQHLERGLVNPPSLEDVLRDVVGAETVEQVYAAFMVAMPAESEAGKRYLRELRERLNMPEDAVRNLHRDLHVPL